MSASHQVTGLVPPDATRQLIAKAQEQATSFAGGGLEKIVNDLQSYGATAASSGISFGLSHIPVAGPVISKIADLAGSKGITKAFEAMLEQAKSRDERIVYTLLILERSVAATVRQAFNTVKAYDQKASRLQEVECRDCQEAFEEARRCHLAQDCVNDLVNGVKMLEELVKDLQAEVGLLKGKTDSRVTGLTSRIDNFRSNHKKSACAGLNKCYYLEPPSVGGFGQRPRVPTVGEHITNKEL